MAVSLRRIVTSAAAALTLVAAFAPVAQAQSSSGNAQDIIVGDGSVECRVNLLNDGDWINCVSSTEAAHQNHAECNPPQALVPSVVISQGESKVGCWNQGSDQPEHHLSPGQPHVFGQNLFWADFGGGIHVVSLQGQYAYAGPEGVSNTFHPARLSSF